MKPSRILIPLDFSPYADFALEYATELAQPLDAQLLLMHVRDADQLNPFYHTGQSTADARETLRTYLKQAEAVGLEIDMVIKHGAPGNEIVELARVENIDLVVIGTRGRTGLSSTAWRKFLSGYHDLWGPHQQQMGSLSRHLVTA